MPETPTRTEFLFMPSWQIALFYVLVSLSTLIFFFQIWQRAKLWLKGKKIDWKPDYLGGFIKYVLTQKKVRTSRPKSGAPMHLLIFYGFLTLFIGTTLLAINTYSPWKFHKGTYYIVYEFTLDIMGIALLVGLLWALFRRMFSKPKSLTSSFVDFHAVYLLLALTITGFILEAARMNVKPKPFDTSAPIGHWLSAYLPTITANSYVALWWVHAVLVFYFIIIVPRLRLRHIIYAIFSTSGANYHNPLGRLPTIPIEEVEQTGKIGVEKPSDYTRWHLMSLDACMECGRCTEVCPAWNVGKVLNPKKVVQDIRSALYTDSSVAETVSEEALWACTTCNACVEACPVLIRHVDLIVDARRFLVAEGKLSGTAATVLRQSQSTRNAWGVPSDEREKWMENENIPLVRDLVSKGEKFDVLFWIGCAGACDPSAIKVVKSVAALLKRANVSFACLGKEESCTGDPARRIGDEFLFQELAQQNIATFEDYGVKTIITTCPHCFNTLKNEYPEFKGNYEVYHHSQYLSFLVQKGLLKQPELENGKYTIHDPCYLGRINEEIDAPRKTIGVPSNRNRYETPLGALINEEIEQQNTLIEPEHNGRKTLCCGAGGGRMWMEEEPSQRPAVRRLKELSQTGADTVVVACPFCRIMLDASLDQAESSKQLKLVDIAEILKEANT